MKTKKEIEEYIKERGKDSFAGMYSRWGKEWIYFQDKNTNRFRGVIERNKYSENATKKYSGVKVKISFKLPGQRGKKTNVYQVYNRKAQKEIIYRMNSRNRTPENRKQFKDFGFDNKYYKNDAVPLVKNNPKKKKIDTLFDEIIWEEVQKIEKYEGKS